ncbi:MAG TPA: hypothetical protein VF845_06740 [Terriglobales bacterium]
MAVQFWILGMHATEKVQLSDGFFVFLRLLQNAGFAHDRRDALPQFTGLAQLMLKVRFLRIARETFFQDLETTVKPWFGLGTLHDASHKDFLLQASMFEPRPFLLLANLLLDLCAKVYEPRLISIRRKAAFDFPKGCLQIAAGLHSLSLSQTLVYKFLALALDNLVLQVRRLGIFRL